MAARLAVSLAAALAAAALAPAVAGAVVTVSYAPGGAAAGMTVTGDDTGTWLVVTRGATSNTGIGVEVAQGTGTVVAGTGCTQVTTIEVECLVTGPRIATADLGAGDDTLQYQFGAADASFVRAGEGADNVEGGNGSDNIEGQGGNDVLQGGGGEDRIDAGPGDDRIGNFDDAGNDTMLGGDGNDRITAFRDHGNDTYSGGAGTDLVTYASRSEGVRVSLDGVANDGGPGEADNVRVDVENLRGTESADTLVGSSGRNLLEGLGGPDVLRGGSPIRSSLTTFVIRDDTLDGGLGADLLQGEGGDDVLLARDAVDDQAAGAMSCGGGSDRLDADLLDDNSRPVPADCEAVDQGAIDEGRNVVIRSARLLVAPSGTVTAVLACPAGVAIGCRGTLALGPARRAGLRGLGDERRYAIRRGRTLRVVVDVPAALARAAARRRAVVPARLVSLETGRRGVKTTIRAVGLR